MKLKCQKHNKRVFVFFNKHLITLHRCDGKKCDSQMLDMGGKKVTPMDVFTYGHVSDQVGRTKQ